MSQPKDFLRMPSMTMLTFGAALLLCVGALAGACSPLTTYNSLAPVDAGADLAQTDVAYGDHPRQKLDIYVPTLQPKAAPVVVVIYGGSWNSGSKSDYAFLGKALSSRGFVTMIADYRLVPEVRFPAFLDDTARAVAFARAHAQKFGGDANKLFLLGHSAGAYNAVMVALDPQYLRSVGLAPADLRGVIGLAGPYDFLPLAVDSTKEAFGQSADLAQTQPINFATRSAPPMLLATGDDDTTVYPRNTIGLAGRLQAAGATAEVRRYAGIGHIGIMLALSRPLRGRAPVLDDVTRFINATR